MSRNKTIRVIILLMSVIVFALTACYKDKTVVPDTGAEITRTVSFANDITPIFNNSCNISGCHTSGGKSPDLTSSNAYNNLLAGNYVNVDAPESSLLYLWMTGKKSTPMPVGGSNRDYNALVLAWIKQGAQNN